MLQALDISNYEFRWIKESKLNIKNLRPKISKLNGLELLSL